MDSAKKEFIDFMLECGVLRFGDFVTKSGRKTPFFINTGYYRTGRQVAKLASYYAKTIYETFGEGVDILFGPAYKGIPLAVAASMELYRLYGKEAGYCSNRKEIKDHGDTGILLGCPIEPGSRVVIIEDVTTAGTSIAETMPILAERGAKVLGLVVSVDRMERGSGEKSALSEIADKYGIRTAAIVTMDDVKEHLSETGYLTEELKAAIAAYYAQYGALR